MGPFVSPRWAQALAWVVTAVIVALNGWLVYEQVREWSAAAGPNGWLVDAGAVAVVAALGALLGWMALRPETVQPPAPLVSVDQVVSAARTPPRHFRRVGVALEAGPNDGPMLAEAVALAAAHQAELVLMHVVESVGGQWYGPQTGDLESSGDEAYLAKLAERLRQEPAARPIAAVRYALAYGAVPRGIVRLVRTEGVDLLVMGGHGHGRVGDVIHGETIQAVRHQLDIPILTVRG
jgi:manganese transport protein